MSARFVFLSLALASLSVNRMNGALLHSRADGRVFASARAIGGVSPGRVGTTSAITSKDVRRKRNSKDHWIEQDFEGHDNLAQIQALVVRDEEVTGCEVTASDVTNTRYFMCSGAILTARHVITTASCVHFAHVYEHHIEAELAVLVGALYERSYAIKVARFEMHPRYVYDADSALHSRHDLAMLFLDCPIPTVALSLPQIPSGEFDDVGHLCCPRMCELMTIVQKWNNRHEARLIKPEHLPSPTHQVIADEELPPPTTESPHKQSCRRRERRAPAKLAPAPVFYSNDRKNAIIIAAEDVAVNESTTIGHSASTGGGQRKFGEPELEDGPSAAVGEAEGAEEMGETGDNETESPSGVSSATTGTTTTTTTATTAKKKKKESLTVNLYEIEHAPLPERLSETNREAVSNFTKIIVDVTLRKLNEMLEEDVATRSGSYLGRKNMSMDGFADILARTIVTTTLNDLNLTDYRLEQLSTAEPPADLYRKCPPLGAPLVLDDTLVGLVAYTCDDLQDWVPWQYVSLSKNLEWIREKTSVEAEDGDETTEHPPSAFSLLANETVLPLDDYANYSNGKTNVDIRRCFVDEQGVARCTTRMLIKDES